MWARLRHRIALALGWTDESATRVALAAKGWLVWPFVHAIALGAGAWSFARPSQLALLDTNKVAQPLREEALYWVGAAFLAVVLVHAVSAVARRLLQRATVVESISTTSRWLMPLLAVPCVAYQRVPGIEKDSPKLSLLLAVLAGVAIGSTVYHARRTRRIEPLADDPAPPGGVRKALGWLAPLVVLALGVAYGWVFSQLSITNHHALNTRTTDLGYYDNIFYQSLHGNPLGCSWVKGGTHASAHFDPILVLLSPLYRIYPRTELILALQSIWLGTGVVPAYLLGRRLLESRPAGVALAAMLVLYPAMHGANMYEFHSLTLIAPLLLWLLYFLETGSPRRYWAILVLLLLCREDVPLLLCVVGFYQIVSRRPGGARQGAMTILVSLVYFVIVKAVFMKSTGLLNAGKDAYSYDYYYEAMNPGRMGAPGLLTSVLTNPVFALKTAVEEPKIIYLLLLMLPLAFVPLLARPGRVMLLYGLAFTTLASRAPVFTIHFQYSSLIYPIGFALVPVALLRIHRGEIPLLARFEPRPLTRAILAGALVVSLLVSWKFGAIVDNQSFRGGFSRVTRVLTPEQKATYAWVDAQATSIPKHAKVGATNKLGSHVSNRKHAYFWHERHQFDYLFVDESEMKAPDLERHKKNVATDFVEVSRLGKLALFKRK